MALGAERFGSSLQNNPVSRGGQLQIGRRNARGVLGHCKERALAWLYRVLSVHTSHHVGTYVPEHSYLTHGGNYVYRLFVRTEV